MATPAERIAQDVYDMGAQYERELSDLRDEVAALEATITQNGIDYDALDMQNAELQEQLERLTEAK